MMGMRDPPVGNVVLWHGREWEQGGTLVAWWEVVVVAVVWAADSIGRR